MNDLFERIMPVLQRFPVEAALVMLSVCSIVAGYLLTFAPTMLASPETVILDMSASSAKPHSTLVIDVAGAVRKPGIYRLKEGARLKDAIEAAGGYTNEVDLGVVGQSLNLARLLTDQDKVYIPLASEMTENISLPLPNSPAPLVRINSATAKELEELPNIGSVTAEKIISSRPYKALEDLETRGILGRKTYDKIKDLISL